MKYLLTGFLCSVLYLRTDIHAGDGALDTSFATGGSLTTGLDWINHQTWPLAGGKFLVFQIGIHGEQVRLLRFLSNGQPDPTWAGFEPRSWPYPAQVAPKPDGSLYIIQSSSLDPSVPLPHFEERRILMSGALDPTFYRNLGTSGHRNFFLDPARTWELQASNTIAGSTTLGRVLPNGTNDPTWTPPATLYWTGSVAPGGKIMLLRLNDSQWERRHADGTLDPSWLPQAGSYSTESMLIFQRANGGIYDLRAVTGLGYTLQLFRLRENGLADASFRPKVQFSSDDEGDFPEDYPCFFEQPDGRLICCGPYWRALGTPLDSHHSREPVRLLADGSIDPTFQLDPAAAIPVAGWDQDGLPLGESAPQMLPPDASGKALLIYDTKIVRIQAYVPAQLQKEVQISLTQASDGNATLLFSGTDLSLNWQLQQSTSLKTWQKVMDLVPDGTGLRSVQVPTSDTRKFYQLTR